MSKIYTMIETMKFMSLAKEVTFTIEFRLKVKFKYKKQAYIFPKAWR